MSKKKTPHELVGFLAVFASQYALDHELDGLHPVHYDLMVRYGARMDAYKRADIPAPPEKVP